MDTTCVCINPAPGLVHGFEGYQRKQGGVQLGGPGFDLYKIFVYFEAVVHESTILSPPRPTSG